MSVIMPSAAAASSISQAAFIALWLLPADSNSAARYKSSMAGFDASLATVADAAALREPFGRFLCFVVFIVFFIIFLDHHVHAQSTHQCSLQVAFRARLRPLRGGFIRSNCVSGFNGFPK